MAVSPDQMTLTGSRLPNVGTQQRRILDMLIDQRWPCATSLASITWAFGSRLSELRARGFDIVKRRCTHPRHNHKALIYQYGIVNE